jgi:hypothetical protein
LIEKEYRGLSGSATYDKALSVHPFISWLPETVGTLLQITEVSIPSFIHATAHTPGVVVAGALIVGAQITC